MSIKELKYNVVKNDGEPSSVTVFAGSDHQVAGKDHPQFKAILDALQNPPSAGELEAHNQRIWQMFDVTIPIRGKFEHVSERVTVAHGQVFFDGDRMSGDLADHLVRFYGEQDNFMPLVNFMEKVQQNPSKHSVEHLYRWLKNRSFGIDADGDIIGYKGVNRDGKNYVSVNSGRAQVNGEVKEGRIPTAPGTTVEMPRSEVTFDPRNGCSTGLHVGTYGYARGWGNVTLRVKVNPRDVVSVPTDSGDAKMRVCRYKVLSEVQIEDTKMLFVPSKIDDRATAVTLEPRVLVAEPEAPKPPIKQRGGRKAAAARKAQAAKKAQPKKHTFPEYYELFRLVDFRALTVAEAKWLYKEWEMEPPVPTTKEALAQALVKEARQRKRELKM